MSRRRFVYRVVAEGKTIRHYHTREAALHRACKYSKQHPGIAVQVQRSQPVRFSDYDGSVYVDRMYVDGVLQ